jgi:3-phosphoshikimate 1-carboxyvinyltransferase
LKSLEIVPSPLEGQIRIPPSKSISHRAVICAGLAEGISRIENVVFSEDIAATLDGMRAMGTTLKGVASPVREMIFDSKGLDNKRLAHGEPYTLNIQGNPALNLNSDLIDCRESGSTLRFLIPLATRSGEKVSFSGQGKLRERPLDIYYQIFKEQGIEYRTTGDFLPLTIKGSLKPGIYTLKGNVSSQFISGLLFLLPLLAEDSKIIMTTPLESQGYVDLTINVLERFGIKVENKDYQEFVIKGKQKYQSCNYRVEGDYSQAAFWIVAGILGGRITCLDLNPDSLQGDRAILKIVRDMGADLQVKDTGFKVLSGQTTGTVIDARPYPDLIPALTVLASLSKGTTHIVNAGRLRIKESDRLKAMTTELNKLGARILEQEEGLIIEGVESLKGGTVESWNDHRIAMSLAVASLRCSEPVRLKGFEAVNKSYPHFWENFSELGGRCYERSMG